MVVEFDAQVRPTRFAFACLAIARLRPGTPKPHGTSRRGMPLWGLVQLTVLSVIFTLFPEPVLVMGCVAETEPSAFARPENGSWFT